MVYVSAYFKDKKPQSLDVRRTRSVQDVKYGEMFRVYTYLFVRSYDSPQ